MTVGSRVSLAALLSASVLATLSVPADGGPARVGAANRPTMLQRATSWAGRRVLPLLLARLRGDFEVTYGDGTIQRVGKTAPKFRGSVRDPGYLFRGFFSKPMTVMGEAIADGAFDLESGVDGVAPEDRFYYSADLEGVLAMSAEQDDGAGKVPELSRLLKDLNKVGNARRAIQFHYDVGNDFYDLWLDPVTRAYSCAYFGGRPDATLAQAQVAKMRLIYNKLGLKKGDAHKRLLDIGSGWGDLAIRAAKERGVRAVGLTLSQDQYDYAVARARREGVGHLVKFELMDFREYAAKHPDARFDAIVSVGMFEHLGTEPHYDEYFESVRRMLADDGRSVLHTITSERQRVVPRFISKFIFPGGRIPAKNSITRKLQQHDFILRHMEDMSESYALTLDRWSDDFRAKLGRIRALVAKDGRPYPERMLRIWWMYLRGSAASFRRGDLSLSQFVMWKTKDPDRVPESNAQLYEGLWDPI